MSNAGEIGARKPKLPIKRPIRKEFPNLAALTKAESVAQRYDIARAGNRAGGVGVVRVNKTKNIYWTLQ